MERYIREPGQPMPYNIGGTLTAGEFLGCNDFGWSDTETMAAWNLLREQFDQPIKVDRAFVRVSQQSFESARQHYAGTAFRMGSNLSPAQLDELYEIANNSGAFSYVAPRVSRFSPLEMDRRYEPSNYFLTFGFPILRRGTVCNQVVLAQDALSLLGYSAGTLDGIYGERTETAVRAFQNDRRLASDGIVANLEWESLLNMAINFGATA